MAHLIQPATTARSKCRGCGERIAAGALRFGEVVPNPFAEGDATQWFHVACGAHKRPEPFLEALSGASEPVPDAESLSAVAQGGVAHPRLARIDGAEHDPSGRATCRHCKTRIEKGAWRIRLVYYEDGRFQPSGAVHVPCARAYFEADDVLPRVRHFAPALAEADLKEIETLLAPAT